MTDSFSFPTGQFILIGKVVKPHGIRGEVKIFPFSQQPENLGKYRHLVLVDGEGRLTVPMMVEKCRVAGKFAVVQLEGITTRERAEQICTMGVLIGKEALPELDDDTFYYREFIGLTVTTENGNVLGTIKNIFSNGAHEIMEIQGDDKHYLIPVLQEIIIAHGPDGLTVAPPPGLLEINQS